jgi:hypothetical protein
MKIRRIHQRKPCKKLLVFRRKNINGNPFTCKWFFLIQLFMGKELFKKVK